MRLCVTAYNCVARINYPSLKPFQFRSIWRAKPKQKKRHFSLRVIFAEDHLKTRNMINKDIIIEHEGGLGKKGQPFFM